MNILNNRLLFAKLPEIKGDPLKRQKLIEHSALYLLTLIFYLILRMALAALSVNSAWLSFAIALLLFMFFSEALLQIIRRLTGKKFYQRVTLAQKILRNLNTQLNQAKTYSDVTGLLFDSFDKLFGSLPHAFYILKNDRFCLQHTHLINDKELLLTDIPVEWLKDIPRNSLRRTVAESRFLPASLRRRFVEAGLSTFFPFLGHEQIFSLLVIDAQRLTCFKDETTRSLFRKIQKKAGLILENKGLLLDLMKKHTETKKLIEVSHKILSAFETKKVLDFILESLQSLIHFDAATIFLLDKSGKRLLNTSSSSYDPNAISQLHLKVGQGSCGWVVQTKNIEVLDDVSCAEHYFNLRPETRSQISIPLIFDNDVLGVLCLESNRLAFFKQPQVEILQLFAHLASLAVHNARQLNVLLAKRALEDELINAGAVQRKLLVHRFPNFDNLKITAVNIPSIIVSGDLYDVIKYTPTTLGLAIGDVSGKGAAAALMMSLILAGLRSQKKTFFTACDTVYRLNNLLYESTVEGKYATFFYAILSLGKNKLIYTNAGHNPPIFIKANGKVVRLEKGGIILGYLQNWEYIQEEIDFEPGDLLVAFTDGVTETQNEQEEEFGDQRLVDLIVRNRNKSVFELKAMIINAIHNFSGEDHNKDDVTLVICKYSAE